MCENNAYLTKFIANMSQRNQKPSCYNTFTDFNSFTISYHFGPVYPRHMGFMVGSGGSTVREVMQETGAYVSARKSDDLHSYPWFLISGNYESVARAVQIMIEIREAADTRIPYKHKNKGPRVTKGKPQVNFSRAQTVNNDALSSKSVPDDHTTGNEEIHSVNCGATDGSQSCEEYNPHSPPPTNEHAEVPKAPRKKMIIKHGKFGTDVQFSN